jgi:hypothetical protein
MQAANITALPLIVALTVISKQETHRSHTAAAQDIIRTPAQLTLTQEGERADMTADHKQPLMVMLQYA